MAVLEIPLTGHLLGTGDQELRNLRLWQQTGTPASPTEGIFWYNSNSGNRRIYFYDNAAAIAVPRLDRAEVWTAAPAFNAQFTVGSTALIASLNADLHDGYNTSTTAVASTIPVYSTGGTLFVATPTLGTHAANRDYVDAMGQGLNPATGGVAQVATIASIANLSSASVVIDGVTLVATNRVLVKDNASPDGIVAVSNIYNGVYVVGTVAGGLAPFTRATDSDSTAELDRQYLTVAGGATNIGRSYFQTTNDPVVNTDPIIYTLFYQPFAFIAGNGIDITGQTISVKIEGSTTYVANSILFNGSTTTIDSSAKLTWDGNTLAIGTAGSPSTQLGMTIVNDFVGNCLYLRNLNTSAYSTLMFVDSTGAEAGAVGAGNSAAGDYTGSVYLAADGFRYLKLFTCTSPGVAQERMKIDGTTGIWTIGTGVPRATLLTFNTTAISFAGDVATPAGTGIVFNNSESLYNGGDGILTFLVNAATDMVALKVIRGTDTTPTADIQRWSSRANATLTSVRSDGGLTILSRASLLLSTDGAFVQGDNITSATISSLFLGSNYVPSASGGASAIPVSTRGSWFNEWDAADTDTNSFIYWFYRNSGGAAGALNLRMSLSGAGNLGIGTAGQTAKLHVLGGGTAVAAISGVQAWFQSSASAATNSYVGFVSGTTGAAGLLLGDTADQDIGMVWYDNNVDAMYFRTNNADRVSISSAGVVNIAGLTISQLVQTDGSKNLISSSDLPTAITIGGAYIYRVGGTDVSLLDGGTGKSLTAVAGAVVWSDADSFELTASGSANQILMSAGTTSPVWSTATYPATTTVSQILYSSSANVVSGLATANSAILVTSAGGVPSLSTDLPAAITIGTKSVARKYSVNFGNGVLTAFTITHNLNTTDVALTVIERGTVIGTLPFWGTIPYWEVTDANTITIRYLTAPASNRYTAVVIG